MSAAKPRKDDNGSDPPASEEGSSYFALRSRRVRRDAPRKGSQACSANATTKVRSWWWWIVPVLLTLGYGILVSLSIITFSYLVDTYPEKVNSIFDMAMGMSWSFLKP